MATIEYEFSDGSVVTAELTDEQANQLFAILEGSGIPINIKC